jgi:hypothetical protein
MNPESIKSQPEGVLAYVFLIHLTTGFGGLQINVVKLRDMI